MRQLIDEMRVEWVELDRRIVALDNEFAALAPTQTRGGLLRSLESVC